MVISQKFGSLPWFSFVWNHGPLAAAVGAFVFNFGAICLLMYLEGRPPWRRTLYKTFLWGDSVFLPLYIAAATVILRGAPSLHGFYAEPWWHLSLLAFGFYVSILMEVGALIGGQYSVRQEFSPSKLWHTLIFGVIFYWVASSLIPVWVTHRPAGAMLCAIIALAGFVHANVRDWRAGLVLPTMHLEGTYFPWKWGVRKQ